MTGLTQEDLSRLSKEEAYEACVRSGLMYAQREARGSSDSNQADGMEPVRSGSNRNNRSDRFLRYER